MGCSTTYRDAHHRLVGCHLVDLVAAVDAEKALAAATHCNEGTKFPAKSVAVFFPLIFHAVSRSNGFLFLGLEKRLGGKA